MNLGDIKTRVASEYGDRAYSQITEADITNWANDGMLEIVKMTACIKTSTTIAAVVGQTEYSLPSDFVKMRRVIYNGYMLSHVTRDEVDKLNHGLIDNPTQGRPGYYYVEWNNMGVYPAPDDTLNFTVEYAQVPTSLSVDGDTPELPEIFHSDIVEYVLMRCARLDGDVERAILFQEDFALSVAETQAAFENPETDTYASIKDFDDADRAYQVPGYW